MKRAATKAETKMRPGPTENKAAVPPAPDESTQEPTPPEPVIAPTKRVGSGFPGKPKE